MMGLGLSIGLDTNGSQFGPSSLSGLAAWYRGDTITTSGGAVTQWDDKSGNGKHLVQATSGKRPTLTASGIGNQPSVVFDGSDDTLECASMTVASGSPFTVLFVGNSATQANRVFLDSFNAVGARLAIYCQTSSQISLYGSAGFGVNGTDMSSSHVVAAVINGASSKLSVDGAAPTTGDVGTAGLASGLRVGIDQDQTAGRSVSGQIAEIVLYSRALTTTEVTQVARYLGARYGITVA